MFCNIVFRISDRSVVHKRADMVSLRGKIELLANGCHIHFTFGQQCHNAELRLVARRLEYSGQVFQLLYSCSHYLGLYAVRQLPLGRSLSAELAEPADSPSHRVGPFRRWFEGNGLLQGSDGFLIPTLFKMSNTKFEVVRSIPAYITRGGAWFLVGRSIIVPTEVYTEITAAQESRQHDNYANHKRENNS